jgi:predicted RNA binding protein YcfA (HicA-like mRNA interferase family)
MASTKKILDAVLSGRSDANIRFGAVRKLLQSLGFDERIKGGHFIYSRGDVVEIINIQSDSGGKAKPYQVKQIRGIITRYGMEMSQEP